MTHNRDRVSEQHTDTDAPQADLPENDPRDQLAQLTLAYLDVLNGSSQALPVLDHIGDDLQIQVLAAWSRIDELVVADPLPLLEADPTAIALGAAPTAALNAAALRELRQKRGLRLSDLSAALQRRGWPTNTKDVFSWERSTQPVAPALLADIAAVLDVPIARLAADQPDTTSDNGEPAAAPASIEEFLRILNSEALQGVVEQWAQLFGLGPAAARKDLQRRLASAVHRGQRSLTTHQWKAVLSVLIASERARRGLAADPPASPE